MREKLKKKRMRPKDLKKLMRKKFACIPDADNDLRLWQSAHPHHSLKNLQILWKKQKRNEDVRKKMSFELNFTIEGEIELNEGALIEARKNLGRFVLASNT